MPNNRALSGCAFTFWCNLPVILPWKGSCIPTTCWPFTVSHCGLAALAVLHPGLFQINRFVDAKLVVFQLHKNKGLIGVPQQHHNSRSISYLHSLYRGNRRWQLSSCTHLCALNLLWGVQIGWLEAVLVSVR